MREGARLASCNISSYATVATQIRADSDGTQQP